MPVNFAWVIARLEANALVFQGLLRGVEKTQAMWKPATGKWSILEVINHVAEEESVDFRTRLRLVLEDPAKDWPPIDPERSVVEHDFNTRDLQESLDRFVHERRNSIDWLRGLSQIDWQVAHTGNRGGPLRAGDLLCSWLAHDLIHIRQINRLHYEYQAAITPEFSPAYAGNW
jgi:hypothetical protein